MRDDRRPPTLRNCTELSTAPRVSARAFPVDANLRDFARLHAGHGAILRFNQSLGYGKLFRHPTAVRRGVGGFRVAKHLHLPVTHDKQAETAGRKRDDALVGERTERFWDGLIRHRVVLHSTAGELDVAVDRDDASDATQSESVVRVRRLPWLGYGKPHSWDRIAERACTTLITTSGSHVRHSDSPVGIDAERSRRLPVRHAYHRVDLDRRP